MKKVTINSQKFIFSENNLSISLKDLTKKIKVVDALLKLKVENYNSSAQKIIIDFCPNSSDGWKNVDTIENIPEDRILTINVSDELQNCLDNDFDELKLRLTNLSQTNLIYDECTFYIEYLPLYEYQNNGSSHNLDLGDAGKFSVNLASKQLSLSVPLVSLNSNILPISVQAKYNSIENELLSNVGLKNNWKLNLHQFLVKELTNEPAIKYTYINENGINEIFEEKYYYTDKNGDKVYVSEDEITMSADGSLHYTQKTQDSLIFTIYDVYLEQTCQNCKIPRTKDEMAAIFNKIEQYKGKKLIIAVEQKKLDSTFSIMDNSFEVDYLNNESNTSFRLTGYIDPDNENEIDESSIVKTLNNGFICEANFNISGAIKFYVCGEETIYEVTKESDNSSNLKLISSVKDIEGSNKINYEPEELAQIKQQIKQLTSSRDMCASTINSLKKQLFTACISHDSTIKDILTRLKENNSNSSLLSTKITLSEIQKQIKNLPDFEKFNQVLTELELINLISELKEVGDKRVKIGEELQQNSSASSYENSPVAMDINIYNSELSIDNLLEQYNNYKEQLKDIESNLEVYNYKLQQYEMMVPIHYLEDENNIIYGFGKTDNKNIFRLVLIMDSYENAVSFNYESLSSNKINSITNSANKTINFEYSEELLSAIVDARNRSTKFEYDEVGNIEKITKPDGSVCKYIYSNNKLAIAINSSGFGARFSYDGNNVAKVESFSVYEELKNGKSIDDIEDFSPYLIDKEFVEIKNNNLKSTTITNGHGKSLTYIFDKLGKVKTIYENEFSNDKKNYSVRAINYEYQNNKVSLKTSSLPYSENYLSDACFEEESMTDTQALYFSENTFCSELTIPYSYKVCDKIHTILAEKENKTNEMSVSETYLNKINNDNTICSHKTFVVSGWAKADSAYVLEDENYEANPNSSAEVIITENQKSYLKTRKFEIRVEVEYVDSEKNVFSKSFDWRNTEWQYCSLPLRLKEKQVASIKCHIDYTNNTGTIEYSDLELKEGDYELVNYDEQNKAVTSESGHSNWVVTSYYNKNNQLKKKVVSHKTDKTKAYETSFEYNKKGKLTKTINYNNIVQENIYDDLGALTKTVTYHKDEPATKFYSEQKLDDNGNIKCSLSELGEEVNSYKYIDGTNIISETSDESGSKTVYGYNSNDIILETSTYANGFNNTNTYGYTLGFLTSLKSNGFDVAYNYDNRGRVAEIKIAGETYLSKTYADKEEITSLANGEEFKQTFNDDGNPLNSFYKKDSEHAWEPVSENIYDSYGNLTYTKDYLDNGNEHNLAINKFGNTFRQYEIQHGKDVVVENSYNENHNNIVGTKISIGETEQAYTYHYSDDLNENLCAIDLPNGLTQMIDYDKLGRTKKLSANSFSKEFEYLSCGDHASNLIASETFATNNVSDECLKYKYDTKGNLTEIRQNNKLVARYAYDSLSRLVREDNKALNKTTSYCYDAGGNILCRTEYNFTLVDNLDFETGITFNYSYATEGWRDQLKCYNGEKFIYDKLGNPLLYRGEVLSWSHGRRLDKFGDIEFKYDASGIRTNKTVNDVETKFYLNGTQILRQEDGTNTLDFFYGADGIVGFSLNGENFVYKKNILGDIIGIIDNTGKEIAKYVYDAWGNHKCYILSNSGKYIEISSDSIYTNEELEYNKIISLNPFRYRGYYFDIETNLYYLNSRYYDSDVGRFLNADSIDYLNPNSINGLNLYNYCNNNPINNIDINGFGWFKNAWRKFKGWVKDTWNTVKESFQEVVDVVVGTIASIGLVAGGVALTIISSGALTNLGAAMIGAGVGGFLGGIQSILDGNSYKNGYLGGAISGGITGLGISYGYIGAVIGGFIGNFAGTFITDKLNEVNIDDYYLLNLTADSILSGMVSIGAYYFGDALNVFKIPGYRDIFTALTVLGEFMFSYLFESSKSFFNLIV